MFQNKLKLHLWFGKNVILCIGGLAFHFHLSRTYPQSLMHCYEVIPEGAVCKLYFDLEFHKPTNEGVDGKSLILLLIQVMNVSVPIHKVTCYSAYHISSEKLCFTYL